MPSTKVIDPLVFKERYWPDVKFYKEQVEIIRSVQYNDETVVPAGNALGKDFIAAFIALWFFCSRRPARVVTTSVKFDQLNDVLWGEMRGFISRAKHPLPIRYTHMRITQVMNDGSPYEEYSCELVGQCVSQGEGLLGRHLPRFHGIDRTLVIFDEASGISNSTYDSCETWAHRKLIIGNCWPTTNFFYEAVKGGDIEAKI